MSTWPRGLVVAIVIATIAVAGIGIPRLAPASGVSGHFAVSSSEAKQSHIAGYGHTADLTRTPCQGQDAPHGKGKHTRRCYGTACVTSSAFIVEQFEFSFPPVELERPSRAIGIHPDAPITLIERPPRRTDA